MDKFPIVHGGGGGEVQKCSKTFVKVSVRLNNSFKVNIETLQGCHLPGTFHIMEYLGSINLLMCCVSAVKGAVHKQCFTDEQYTFIPSVRKLISFTNSDLIFLNIFNDLKTLFFFQELDDTARGTAGYGSTGKQAVITYSYLDLLLPQAGDVHGKRLGILD